jgi:putative restriction endonuclease
MEHPEAALRRRVFARLDAMLDGGPGFLDRMTLERFTLDNHPLRLLAPQQGIMNPVELEASISAMNSLKGPYKDGSPSDGIWDYAYQGETTRGTNTKLRRAMELELEIIYFEQIATNLYVPIYPVSVVGDRPRDLRFELALSPLASLGAPVDDTPIERVYREATVRQRMHQPKFRARVLYAYSSQCTVCHLRHAEFLDAAHIIADKDDWGEAMVPNGMSMCKIHHAAYDGDFLGVTPDFEIRINSDLLAEQDGPMLLHGLQEMHGACIILPARKADYPDRERLDRRFREFQDA